MYISDQPTLIYGLCGKDDVAANQ